MECDLCGSGGQLYRAKVEGTILTVCERCKEHGEVLERIPNAAELKAAERATRHAGGPAPGRPAPSFPARQAAPAGEVLLIVRDDYGPVIRQARERMGLKQEELAKRLRMKESQLHKHESGTKRPDLETARLLEKALRISLVREHVEERSEGAAAESGPVTIGDLLRGR